MAMKTYIHSIPGRLRLRDEALKADSSATQALQTDLRQLPGITAVDFHPSSSSLVMHYDPDTLAPEQMLITLRAHGYLHGEFKTNVRPPAAKQSSSGKLSSRIVRGVKDAAISGVAGYLIEAAVIRYVPNAALPLLLLSLARKRGPF
jgi:hypothetical protein